MTTLSYMIMAVQSGWVVHRSASGNVTELVNDTYLDCNGRNCQYGLQNNFQVGGSVAEVRRFRPEKGN